MEKNVCVCVHVCACVCMCVCVCVCVCVQASQVVVVKNPPANAGDARDAGLVPPSSGRSPGGGNGNPLQYSCLENNKDRGALRATVHGVTESRTQLGN